MNSPHGPWSTSIDSSRGTRLSTFWKRRLALLSSVSGAAPGVRRWRVLGLALLLPAILIWPTWQLGAGPGDTADEHRAESGNQSQVSATASPRDEFLPRPTPNEAKIYAELEKSTRADYFDQPLSDVIQSISEVHLIPIIIETKALEDAAVISSEIRVSVGLAGISLRSLLKILLAPEGLTYVIEDDVMKITTTEEAGSKLSTRVYPVTDLLGPDKDFQPLIETIQKTVPSTEWEETDGTGGTITPNDASKSLVVKQTFGAHSGILDLLRNLRAAQEKPTEKKSAAN